MPSTDYLSVAEVASRIGVHVRTVHRWIQLGQLDASKLGTGLRSAYMVSRESVEAFESRRRAA